MLYLQLFLEFAKVGLFTIGGGMASVPLLEALQVKTGWFTAEQLVNMIAISESTPGPLGINMATYVGFLTAGPFGALIATIGIVLPTVMLVLIVAKYLQTFKDNFYVKSAMYGLRAASTGLIAAAGVSVATIALADQAALAAKDWLNVIDIKTAVLAAVVLVLTNYVKPTKKLHPVAFIALSAVAGVVFQIGGF